jgi:hypothetical protein
MLIEIWERLRGYDKWIETEAEICRPDVEETIHHGRGGPTVSYSSVDELMWTDLNGERQYAMFSVPQESPLFQMAGGEKVTIRYNPKEPEAFYYRDLLRSRIRDVFRNTLILLAGCLVAWLFIWIRSR